MPLFISARLITIESVRAIDVLVRVGGRCAAPEDGWEGRKTGPHSRSWRFVRPRFWSGTSFLAWSHAPPELTRIEARVGRFCNSCGVSIPAYSILDVSAWDETNDEQIGSKPKIWLESEHKERWLFKQVRTDSEGRPQGEDWAEKAASELALLFGIPAAAVELATRRGANGIISRKVHSDGYAMVHGNELLHQHDSAYPREDERHIRGYTLDAIEEALKECLPPPDTYPQSGWRALDVFAGYLFFDAWIANMDRHHLNWAVLTSVPRAQPRLAPSFDHASSLGFQVRDSERARRLKTNDAGYSVGKWASRGKSIHFETGPTLVDLAHEALSRAQTSARKHWIGQLSAISAENCLEILDRLPDSRVSESARTFAGEILKINRERLLDGI